MPEKKNVLSKVTYGLEALVFTKISANRMKCLKDNNK